MQNPKKEENNIGQARIEENFLKIQRKFKKGKSWFELMKNADHGFVGMEKQVARLCIEFTEKICR